MRRSATLLSLLLLGTSCIAPSVVDPGDRSLVMGYEDLQWSPVSAAPEGAGTREQTD